MMCFDGFPFLSKIKVQRKTEIQLVLGIVSYGYKSFHWFATPVDYVHFCSLRHFHAGRD